MLVGTEKNQTIGELIAEERQGAGRRSIGLKS